MEERIHKFDCCEPWFSLIKSGKKVVEGRINSKKYSSMQVGDKLILSTENEFLRLTIKKITKYKSFEDMIICETLERVLPNIETIEEGIKVYKQFYKPEIEKHYGVIAIKISVD
uniref:ASCH domain-containing protein n=1 Tax=viral metagenome TaxID=1070528 RepID=A0A6C0ADQ5_9ZZZZ